jgi:plastocyanin
VGPFCEPFAYSVLQPIVNCKYTISMTRHLSFVALTAVFALAQIPAAQAAPGEPTLSVTLKDHRFTPAEFSVPAGVKVRVNLTNLDAATEEFDSHDLRVEELVTPHGRASFLIGPLKAGSYSFMGEFHPATAQGHVTVKEGR